jgi:hypothetical protein
MSATYLNVFCDGSAHITYKDLFTKCQARGGAEMTRNSSLLITSHTSNSRFQKSAEVRVWRRPRLERRVSSPPAPFSALQLETKGWRRRRRAEGLSFGLRLKHSAQKSWHSCDKVLGRTCVGPILLRIYMFPHTWRVSERERAEGGREGWMDGGVDTRDTGGATLRAIWNKRAATFENWPEKGGLEVPISTTQQPTDHRSDCSTEV